MKDKVKMLSKLKLCRVITLLTAGCCFSLSAAALTFSLPSDGDIVGEIQTATVRKGESLGELGRRFDVGVYEMIEANPNLDPWVPMPGAIAVIPTQFILPCIRSGIVLNLAEMRLYYFHPDQALVTTHPLGIGKKGWSTPLGHTVIVNKKKDPPWYPPESIRQEHIAKGDPLPPGPVRAGADNPLGRYAFYVSVKGLSEKGSYMIHGTNRPGGVGVRSTHGCIRLLPEDIEHLFNIVPIGTTVQFIHEPYKVGWHKGHLYLEAHQPVTEDKFAGSTSTTHLQKVIEAAIAVSHTVNWTSAQMFAKKANGYPVQID